MVARDPLVPAVRLMVGAFAAYAVWTVPSLAALWGWSGAGVALLCGWLALAAVAWPVARGALTGARFWVALAAVAVGLRLLAWALVAGHAPTGDAYSYPQIAGDLLAGNGLVFRDYAMGWELRGAYPPLYPVLLAGAGAVFGLATATYWWTNLLVETAAALLVVRIGRELGHAAGGRAAAWLLAVWPTAVLAAPFAAKEPLQTLFALVGALMIVRLRARPRPGWGDGAAMGLATAGLALTQPGTALLPALFALALLPVVGFAPLWLLAVRAIPFAVVAMAPWWVRNGIVFGRFVPLTSTGGASLWIGNNPGATGGWMPLPDDYRATFRAQGEVAMAERAGAAASAWIAAHPAEFVRLSLTKLARAVGIEQYTLVRFAVLRPPLGEGVAPMLLPLLQGALAAAWGAAFALAARARQEPGGAAVLLLALAALLQLPLFGMWFEFGERHRYFAMPFLFLAVGWGLSLDFARGERRWETPRPLGFAREAALGVSRGKQRAA